MKRTALVVWQGNANSGSGRMTIQDSSLVDILFSFKSRFESKTKMSPEGLLAAAHAASFAMSFEEHLEAVGLGAERIDTVAIVNVEIVRGLQTITQVELELIVHTASLDRSLVIETANRAKSDCSISRLVNAKITLNVKIEGSSNFSAA